MRGNHHEILSDLRPPAERRRKLRLPPEPVFEREVPPPQLAAEEESFFIKTVKRLPSLALDYLKSGPEAVNAAKLRRDRLSAGLMAGVLFLAQLILGICFFARMSGGSYYTGLGVLAGAFGGLYFRFHMGFVLLGAVIMTLTTGILYIGARVLSQLIFAKRRVTDAIGDALIEFGLHSVPASGLLLAAALLGLIDAWFVIPFVGLAAGWYTTVFFLVSVRESEGSAKPILRAAILALTVTAALGAAFRILSLVCAMNYSLVPTL